MLSIYTGLRFCYLVKSYISRYSMIDIKQVEVNAFGSVVISCPHQKTDHYRSVSVNIMAFGHLNIN